MDGMAAVALSVAFASLFMMRFCELQRYAPLLRVPIMALAVGMVQLVLMRCSHVDLLIELAKLLLNPLLMLGTGLLLLAAIVVAIRGSHLAWFFLADWTPLLLLTATTSAQVDGALPELAACGSGDVPEKAQRPQPDFPACHSGGSNSFIAAPRDGKASGRQLICASA
ncbi:MAG TPA: hypothetical protein VGC19_15555 [Rhodanobacter sp.]